MAKKQEPVADPKPEHPKPVMAIEYNGELYPTLQTAEAARAKADLMGLMCQPEERGYYDTHSAFVDSGKRKAIDAAIKHAEAVSGILARYLAAANIR